MVSAADSVTGLTGLTVTVTISKNGAAFASAGGSVTEIGNGWYYLGANTTDTGTLGDLLLHATATGADPTDAAYEVVADLPGASVGSVTGAVGSVTGNVGGNVVGTVASVVGAVGSVTATVSANIVGIIATALSEGSAGYLAAAFKKFFNLASPTSTMNEITLVDSVTTYTGNTPQTGDSFARLGAPAGASIAADIAEVEGETDAIGTNVLAIPTTPLLASNYTAPNNAGIATLIAGVTVTTNSDKTGYSLAASQVPIKKNTALSGFQFPMSDSTNHLPATGLNVAVQRSIDGGAFANCTNAATEIGSGVYTINLSAADLNGGSIILKFTASASDTRFATLITQ